MSDETKPPVSYDGPIDPSAVQSAPGGGLGLVFSRMLYVDLGKIKAERAEMLALLREAAIETQPNAVCGDIHADFRPRLLAMLARIDGR